MMPDARVDLAVVDDETHPLEIGDRRRVELVEVSISLVREVEILRQRNPLGNDRLRRWWQGTLPRSVDVDGFERVDVVFDIETEIASSHGDASVRPVEAKHGRGRIDEGPEVLERNRTGIDAEVEKHGPRPSTLEVERIEIRVGGQAEIRPRKDHDSTLADRSPHHEDVTRVESELLQTRRTRREREEQLARRCAGR